jgi:uncharacterized protein (DUF58 family)
VSQVSRYLEPALVEHLNHMQLLARSVVQGSTTGQHRSPVKGASVEFRQHRFYVPGDEPRRLDWRVLARTDRPYVKEYDEETNLRCVLMFDASGSMGYGDSGRFGTKFGFAARLVAALAYLMLGQNESVGLAVCGDGVDSWLAPHAGAAQLPRVLDRLEQSTAAGPGGLARALHEVAERLERRGLVIVVSDFFAPVEQLRGGLAHLRHGRHEVVAIQVVDPEEESFPFRRWTRFRGLEGESARLCEPAAVRRMYQENFARHRRALQEVCVGLRVDFRAFATEQHVLDVIRALVS